MDPKYILYLFLFSATLSCKASQTPQSVVVKRSNIEHKQLKVSGMTCVGCEVTLESALKKIVGVVKVKASHSETRVDIDFDKTKTNIATIKTTINEAGYQVRD